MLADKKRLRWFAAVIAVVALTGMSLWRSLPRQVFFRALSEIGKNDFARSQPLVAQLESSPGCEQYSNCLKGATLLRRGHFHQALRYFSRTKPEGELRPVVLLLTGECLYQIGRLVESEWTFLQFATEYPENAEGHRWLGTLYFDMGVTQAAVKELELALRINPDDFKAHSLLGLIHFIVEQYGQAIHHYRSALEFQSDTTIEKELAISLFRLQRYQEALDVLDSNLNSIEKYVLKAECLVALGDTKRSHQTLNEARLVNPNARSVLLLTAKTMLEQKQYESAAALLTNVLDQDPHDSETRYQLAMCLRDRGMIKEYKEEMMRFGESRKLHEQYAELSKQAQLKPNDPIVREELAQVADKLGKHEISAIWKRAAGAFRPIP